MELVAEVAGEPLVREGGRVDPQSADDRRGRHEEIPDCESAKSPSSTARHEDVLPFVERVRLRELWNPLEKPLLGGHRALVEDVQHVLLDRSVLVQRGVHALAHEHLSALR